MIMEPLFRSRITKMIKSIIGKNHDFCVGELPVLWAEVIATVAILPGGKVIGSGVKIPGIIWI
jgi:hypothetical protein